MNHDWLKNLARAQWQQGEWRVVDPAGVQKRAVSQAQDLVWELLQAAQDATFIFNPYNHRTDELRVASLDVTAASPYRGFVLLMGGVQLRIQWETEDMVTATGVWLENFQKRERQLHRFIFSPDALGDLQWRDDQLLLNSDQLLKQLLADICMLYDRLLKKESI